MRSGRVIGLAKGVLVANCLASPLTFFIGGAYGAPSNHLRHAHHHSAPTAPGVVRDVKVRWSNRGAGAASATILWLAPTSDGGSPITGYAVISPASGCVPPSLASAMTCTIDSLKAGRSYDFTVTATNSVGTSSRVVRSTLGALGQGIDFPPLSNAIFSLAPIKLIATASSGLPVTFAAAGACTVVGESLTLTSVGSCAVTASQRGSREYISATPVANFFQISQATAVLTTTSELVVANGATHSISVTVTPPATGVKLNFCLSNGFGGEVCSNDPPREPGLYKVTAQLSNLDYVAKPISTTLTIEAPQAFLPDDLLGGTSTPHTGTTKFAKYGVDVHTIGSGFTAGHTVDVGVISEESLGGFVVPVNGSDGQWLNLLRCSSTSTSILGTRSIHAFTAQGVSVMGSLAYPGGNFPGAGQFELIVIQSSGFIPHSTVSAVLHSAPAVLSQAVANANGIVTIVVPVAKSFAGQLHHLFLTGTYLVTTTTASADGTAGASVTVSKSLLSRLVVGAPVVMVFRDSLDPSITSTNSASLPTQAVYAAFVRINTPLHLAKYNPVNHPGSTLKGVTGAAAALSAVAAGVAVARAAGSMGSAASHAASASSRGASAAHRGSMESIEAVHHTHDRERVHIGDHSFTWRAPGRRIVDDLSIVLPLKLAKYSPLAAISIADAGYWRAMFGSLSLVFPFAGGALGIMAATQTHGYPLPPTLGLFVAIIVLGFLDATAGLAAAAASLTAAIFTGHLFSLNMVISGLLLATLWFGLPVMVKKVRPFVRPHPRTFQQWWVRGADLFVGPAFAGLLAAKLVDSFSLVSNLKIGIVEQGNLIGWIVGGVAVARYLIATSAVFFYPKRLGDVTPVDIPAQEPRFIYASIVLRMFFAALIFTALLGQTWFVPPLVFLLGFGMYVRGAEVHVEIPNWAYRLIPRNVAKILLFEVVGTVVTGVVTTHVASPYWQISALLFTILLLGLVVDLLTGARGRDWPVNWWVRIGGAVLFLVTVAQMSDLLIT